MQLTCLAEASKGAYFSAGTAGELQQALLKVTEQIELYDPSGKSKYEFTRIGQSIEILSGYYSIKVGSHWIRDIELSDGQQLELPEPVD